MLSKSRLVSLIVGGFVLCIPYNMMQSAIVDVGRQDNIIQTIATDELVEVFDEVYDTNQMTIDRYKIEDVKEEVKEEKKDYKVVDCELTFYTSLASCNSSANVGKTATGYLKSTSIAIPRKSMPFGTKIDLGEYGVRLADDVGNSKYIRIKEDGTYRFDVYIPRNKGESDSAYHKRVTNMGRVKTTAKVYYVE